MKTTIIIILSLCLAVSLWINRENNKSTGASSGRGNRGTENRQNEAASSTEKPALQGAVSIDFSDTPFSDDAWKLDKSSASGTPGSKAGDSSSPLGSALKLELPGGLQTLDIPDSVMGTVSPGEKTESGKQFNSLLTNPNSN